MLCKDNFWLNKDVHTSHSFRCRSIFILKTTIVCNCIIVCSDCIMYMLNGENKMREAEKRKEAGERYGGGEEAGRWVEKKAWGRQERTSLRESGMKE